MRITILRTDAGIQVLEKALLGADLVAFDLETDQLDELREGAFIVSIALTIVKNGDVLTLALPLGHPDSPWLAQWKTLLGIVAGWVRKVPVRVGHNSKFDCRWLVQFDAPIPATFDTQLAAHLVDENRPKGLKWLAENLCQAPPWDINIKVGKRYPPWYTQQELGQILRYNGLDTYWTYRLYDVLTTEYLSAKERQPRNAVRPLPSQSLSPRLRLLHDRLLMPASQSLVYVERQGAYVDRVRLEQNSRIVEDTLKSVESELLRYVPSHEFIPEDVGKVSWNASKFLRWLVFDHLQCPVILETKSGPSLAKESLIELRDRGYTIANLLLERSLWAKRRSTYFDPYQELITPESRIYTTFKLCGTVTGRLSSGKADAEKATGIRASGVKGINYQNIPRIPLVRTVFGAPEGWLQVSADYSQIELRVAAEIANERNMLRMYALGQDVHMAMAMKMTGKPADRVTKEERTKAKAVNFGFLYGMSWGKFIIQAWNDYGVRVSEREAQAFRTAFFTQFPDFHHWHAKQRRLVNTYKRVESPLGRVRHLPDIDSRIPKFRAEAERQAINSPVQAMGSDICLLSLSLLHRKLRKMDLRTIIVGPVHDAINFEVPEDELKYVLPIIKSTMENPPTQLFGYEMKVPLVVDISVGQHWGEQEEVEVSV